MTEKEKKGLISGYTLMLALIAILCIFALEIFPGQVNADEVHPIDVQVLNIDQGGDVYLGEYINLQRIMGWNQELAHWNSNHIVGYDQPDIVVDASGWRSKFYIDPLKFSAYGDWYEWGGSNSDLSDYRTFRILPGSRALAEKLNLTVESFIKPKSTQITFSHNFTFINDILAARNTSVTYHTDLTTGIAYIIGEGNDVQKKFILNNQLVLNPEDTNRLSKGIYDILIQDPGPNGIYDISIEPDRISSPWKKIPDLSRESLSAQVTEQYFLSKLSGTDDQVTKVQLQIEDPEILEISAIYPANNTLFIQGITTATPGTILTGDLDRDRHYPFRTIFPCEVIGPGNAYRAFNLTIPVGLDILTAGTHSLILTDTTSGKNRTYDFTIQQHETLIERAPPKYDKVFITDTGIFSQVIEMPTPVLPTPTPEIVYVYVTPTPNPEPTFGPTHKAVSAITTGDMILIGILAGIFAGAFLLHRYRRAIWEKIKPTDQEED